MAFLNRQQLLAKEDLEIRKVDLGKGDFVYVKQMTARERDTLEQTLLTKVVGKDGGATYEQNLKDFRSKLAVNTVCDEKGNLLLKPGDFETLANSISAARMERIINVAQELNKITHEDKDALVKNSGNDPAGASPSDSAKN